MDMIRTDIFAILLALLLFAADKAVGRITGKRLPSVVFWTAFALIMILGIIIPIITKIHIQLLW